MAFWGGGRSDTEHGQWALGGSEFDLDLSLRNTQNTDGSEFIQMCLMLVMFKTSPNF